MQAAWQTGKKDLVLANQFHHISPCPGDQG